MVIVCTPFGSTATLACWLGLGSGLGKGKGLGLGLTLTLRACADIFPDLTSVGEVGGERAVEGAWFDCWARTIREKTLVTDLPYGSGLCK